MSRATPKLMSLAAALAALAGTSAVLSDPSEAKITPSESDGGPTTAGLGVSPNRMVSTGRDLLGFTVTKGTDGIMVAQHASHASHSSHSSHFSSSR
jgi:hypothetical protein